MLNYLKKVYTCYNAFLDYEIAINGRVLKHVFRFFSQSVNTKPIEFLILVS